MDLFKKVTVGVAALTMAVPITASAAATSGGGCTDDMTNVPPPAEVCVDAQPGLSADGGVTVAPSAAAYARSNVSVEIGTKDIDDRLPGAGANVDEYDTRETVDEDLADYDETGVLTDINGSNIVKNDPGGICVLEGGDECVHPRVGNIRPLATDGDDAAVVLNGRQVAAADCDFTVLPGDPDASNGFVASPNPVLAGVPGCKVESPAVQTVGIGR